MLHELTKAYVQFYSTQREKKNILVFLILDYKIILIWLLHKQIGRYLAYLA